MSSQFLVSKPLSKEMQILIADLEAVRSEENGEHVDRMIDAARQEYYNDDYTFHPTGSATPGVDLLAHLKRLGLSTLLTNALNRKYDKPQSTEL